MTSELTDTYTAAAPELRQAAGGATSKRSTPEGIQSGDTVWKHYGTRVPVVWSLPSPRGSL